ARRLPEAGEKGREDVMVACEQGQDAVPCGDAGGAVQEQDRRALAGVEDLDRRPSAPEGQDPRPWPAHRYPSLPLIGILRSRSRRRRPLGGAARRLALAAGYGPLRAGKRLRRPVVLVLAPDGTELRHDVRREEVGRPVGELDRRRSDVAAEREVADAERARELLELLADRRRRAGDDVALLA